MNEAQQRALAAISRADERAETGPINVTANAPRILRPARPAHVRRTFAGTVAGDLLTVSTGAHEVETDKEGSEIRRAFNAKKPCPLELGDLAVVEQSGDLAVVEVTAIKASTWTKSVYAVVTRTGRLLSSSCWVLPATGLRK